MLQNLVQPCLTAVLAVTVKPQSQGWLTTHQGHCPEPEEELTQGIVTAGLKRPWDAVGPLPSLFRSTVCI